MRQLANKADLQSDMLYQKAVTLVAMVMAKHGQYNGFCALADAVEMLHEDSVLILGDDADLEEHRTGQVIVKLVESLKPLDVDYSNGNIEMRRKMVDELKKAILKLEVTE